MSLKSKIEAVIYASEEPVTLAQLAGLLGEEAQAEMDEVRARQAELALESESASQQVSESAEDAISEEAEVEASAGVGDQHAAPVEAEDVVGEDPSLPEAVVGQDEVSEGAPVEESTGAEEPVAAAELIVNTEAEKKRQREAERAVREYLRQELDTLMREYSEQDRGIEVREVAGGFRMGTKPEYHDAVRGFVKSLKPPLKLSLQALETLAVVAYKQPVTAAEISEIRGVDSAGVLGGLMTRKLIATAGRKQVVGRPMLYKTTKDFLVRFGLKDVQELPSIEEFERMAGELAEQEDLPIDQEFGQTPTDSIVENANARGDAEMLRESAATERAAEAAMEDADPVDHTGETIPEGGESSEPLNQFLNEAEE